ncbi:MAG: SDR family NAD(P)-dependent oxidoreductase, partial [Thermodesulfobacteriota bacterium]
LVLARELGARGARVAICARDRDELERAQRDLAERGHDVLAVPCDVTRREEVDELVERVLAAWGRVDVLVNNAGEIEVGPLEEMTLEDFERALAIYFWAHLYTTLAVLPDMQRRRSGRIVNVSSIGGKMSVPHLAPYSAAKHASVGLSRALRVELAQYGIAVTTVVPGLMRTGSPVRADFKGQHRKEYAWFSIGDSLPLLTTSAERAARQIVRACRRGDAEVVLTIPARIADLAQSLFPGLTSDALSLVNRLLPGPGGIGRARAEGRDSQSALSPSLLTALGDAAAARNNE